MNIPFASRRGIDSHRFKHFSVRLRLTASSDAVSLLATSGGESGPLELKA